MRPKKRKEAKYMCAHAMSLLSAHKVDNINWEGEGSNNYFQKIICTK